MVLTTEGKIMPPQLSRILKLRWCRTVRYGRQRPNRGCQERLLRVEPLRSRARSGKVRKSALCSRSLTTRRMGEGAPFQPFPLGTRNGEGGWISAVPDMPGPRCPNLKSCHLLPDATTFDTAPNSALPLVGLQAEEYPLP
jgi:hypothetical protein